MSGRDTQRVSFQNVAGDADALVDELVDGGAGTAEELRQRMGWTDGKFRAALKYARETTCPALGMSIPAANPQTGWRYEVTTEWEPVGRGAGWTLGLVETRLASVLRDVQIIAPHLEKGTVEWRRARFLQKHVSHIINTLGEINGKR